MQLWEAWFFGLRLYKSKIEKIDRSSSLEDKLAVFREATIQKFSLTEGPALISAIALMNTENLLYLGIALALIAYLFSLKITQEKIIEELGLD